MLQPSMVLQSLLAKACASVMLPFSMNLLDTLGTLTRRSCSISHTARAWVIHRASLLYRLEEIELARGNVQIDAKSIGEKAVPPPRCSLRIFPLIVYFLLQQKGRFPCCRQCPALLAALTVVSLLNPKSLISHFPMRQRGNPETAGEAGWGGF